MVTEQDIVDMYLHLRKTNMSIPDEALDYMKNVCLESLDKSRFSFTEVCRPTKCDDEKMNGVWTDGVSLLSDFESYNAYPLKERKVYKISIVEVKK